MTFTGRKFRSAKRQALSDKYCNFKFPDEKKWKQVILKDISSNGIGVLAEDTSFFEGDKLFVRFSLAGRTIDCKVRVTNIYGRACGAEFIAISEEDQEMITNFVSPRQLYTV
jgi:c-di-GMP-binding flagellar brake protein YcgR